MIFQPITDPILFPLTNQRAGLWQVHYPVILQHFHLPSSHSFKVVHCKDILNNSNSNLKLMNKTKPTLTIGLNYANIALQSIYR